MVLHIKVKGVDRFKIYAELKCIGRYGRRLILVVGRQTVDNN